MKNKWTLTKFITAGGFSGLLLISLIPGSILNGITGTPNIGGVINAFIYTIFVPLFVILIDQSGAATLILTIFSIFALPFPLIGTPGFLFKIPILIFSGFIIDIVYHFLRKKQKIFFVLVGGFFLTYVNTAVVLFAGILNIPGQEFATRYAFKPITIFGFFLIGLVGGLISNEIFKKIKSTTIIKRIQK